MTLARLWLPAAALAALSALAAGCNGSHDGCWPIPEIEREPGWEPPTAMAKWSTIAIHHGGTPGGSAAIFDKFHREVHHWENGLGYHFVIGNGVDVPDGEVEIGNRWTSQITGAHVGGDLNKESIGVCLVGDFSRTFPTEKQMASLHKLLRFLQARCQIPADKVLGHCEIRPGHTICPGPNFSMPNLRAALEAQPPVYRTFVTDAGDPPPVLAPTPRGLRPRASVRRYR